MSNQCRINVDFVSASSRMSAELRIWKQKQHCETGPQALDFGEIRSRRHETTRRTSLCFSEASSAPTSSYFRNCLLNAKTLRTEVSSLGFGPEMSCCVFRVWEKAVRSKHTRHPFLVRHKGQFQINTEAPNKAPWAYPVALGASGAAILPPTAQSRSSPWTFS